MLVRLSGETPRMGWDVWDEFKTAVRHVLAPTTLITDNPNVSPIVKVLADPTSLMTQTDKGEKNPVTMTMAPWHIADKGPTVADQLTTPAGQPTRYDRAQAADAANLLQYNTGLQASKYTSVAAIYNKPDSVKAGTNKNLGTFAIPALAISALGFFWR